MVRNIAVGLLLMILTTAVHAVFMMLTLRILKKHAHHERRHLAMNRLYVISGSILIMFSALGYGDVVLDGQWRLISAFEAANGIIMFGWTTAIVIAVVQRVYFPTRAAQEE